MLTISGGIHRFMFKQLLVLLTVLTTAAWAQQAPAPTSKPDVTFTKNTEVVLVPVVVTGKKNEHVFGLKKDDFALLEDGKRRDIASFDVVHTEPRVQRRYAAAGEIITNAVEAAATQGRL